MLPNGTFADPSNSTDERVQNRFLVILVVLNLGVGFNESVHLMNLG